MSRVIFSKVEEMMKFVYAIMYAMLIFDMKPPWNGCHLFQGAVQRNPKNAEFLHEIVCHLAGYPG